MDKSEEGKRTSVKMKFTIHSTAKKVLTNTRKSSKNNEHRPHIK